MFWFQCPACGHGAFTSVVHVRPQALPRAPFRFLCVDCGGRAVLRGALWKPGAFAFCAFGVGFLALIALLQLLPHHSMGAAVIASLITFASWLILGRIGNRYERDGNIAP